MLYVTVISRLICCVLFCTLCCQLCVRLNYNLIMNITQYQVVLLYYFSSILISTVAAVIQKANSKYIGKIRFKNHCHWRPRILIFTRGQASFYCVRPRCPKAPNILYVLRIISKFDLGMEPKTTICFPLHAFKSWLCTHFVHEAF